MSTNIKNKYKKYKYSFFKQGYVVIHKFLSKSDLEDCHNQLIKSYNKILNKNINQKNIDQILILHEKNKDWDKMYKAFKEVSNSNAFKKISQKLMILGKKILNIKLKNLNTAYAIGMKSNNRTSYFWHQEKSYYSNVISIHFHFPFFRPLNKKNGTMSFLEKSHSMGKIRNLYNKQKHSKSVYSFVPKEIKEIKKNFKEKFLTLPMGDVCLFHENIIHRTNVNKTNQIRFAGIVRFQELLNNQH
jgi:ectoine hydroxylase-related dioxygenase (phytanoyl-CoA dioxygenase family)